MRSTALYAPDGMTGAGMVRVEDRHDDGLVHNHAWAMSGKFDTVAKAVPGRMASNASFVAPARVDRSVHADDRYDDGLVHNHHWAVSGQ